MEKERPVYIEKELAEFIAKDRFIREDMEQLVEEVNENKLGEVLEEVSDLINDSDSAKKEKLFELKDDLIKAMDRYMETIARSMSFSENRTAAFHDPEKYRDALIESDKRRSIAHDAMMDAFNIFFRNCYKEVGEDMEPFTRQYAGDPKNKPHRRKISNLAKAYVWKRINDQLEAGQTKGEEKSV